MAQPGPEPEPAFQLLTPSVLPVSSQCSQGQAEQPGIQTVTEFLLLLPRVTVTWRPRASGALGEPVLGLHKAFGSHTKEVPVISKAEGAIPG